MFRARIGECSFMGLMRVESAVKSVDSQLQGNAREGMCKQERYLLSTDGY